MCRQPQGTPAGGGGRPFHRAPVLRLPVLSQLPVSQLAYFFSAFSGMLPEGQGFTSAAYARRGFFELTAIAAVNILLLLLVLLLAKRGPTGRISPGVKALSLFIGVFTLLLGATAFSQDGALYPPVRHDAPAGADIGVHDRPVRPHGVGAVPPVHRPFPLLEGGGGRIRRPVIVCGLRRRGPLCRRLQRPGLPGREPSGGRCRASGLPCRSRRCRRWPGCWTMRIPRWPRVRGRSWSVGLSGWRVRNSTSKAVWWWTSAVFASPLQPGAGTGVRLPAAAVAPVLQRFRRGSRPLNGRSILSIFQYTKDCLFPSFGL